MINTNKIKIIKILKKSNNNIILLGIYNKKYMLITLFNVFSNKLSDYTKLFNKSKLELHNKNNYFFSNKFITNGSINITYPVTLQHIKDLNKEQYIKFNESYKYYKKILKYNPNFFNNNWVENILFATSNKKYYKNLQNTTIKSIKSEKKRIIYFNKSYIPNGNNTNKFVICKSSKWTDNNKDNLSLLVWTMDKSLLCLRSLTSTHLKLLEHIKKTILYICKKKYKLLENDINIFFHYLPSVYQLHIHVYNKKINIGFYPGKAHLLNQVMSNISTYSKYYQTFDLTVFIKKNSKYLE